MIPAEQSVTRSWLSWFVMSFQPLLTPPTMFFAGTRASSKKTELMLWSEIRSRGSMRIPGVFFDAYAHGRHRPV